MRLEYVRNGDDERFEAAQMRFLRLSLGTAKI
jgi:hypothetical protein